jgi:hypothetical protein
LGRTTNKTHLSVTAPVTQSTVMSPTSALLTKYEKVYDDTDVMTFPESSDYNYTGCTEVLKFCLEIKKY